MEAQRRAYNVPDSCRAELDVQRWPYEAKELSSSRAPDVTHFRKDLERVHSAVMHGDTLAQPKNVPVGNAPIAFQDLNSGSIVSVERIEAATRRSSACCEKSIEEAVFELVTWRTSTQIFCFCSSIGREARRVQQGPHCSSSQLFPRCVEIPRHLERCSHQSDRQAIDQSPSHSPHADCFRNDGGLHTI